MTHECTGSCERLRKDPASEPLAGLDRLIDLDAGRLSRRVYWDQRIYEQELEDLCPELAVSRA